MTTGRGAVIGGRAAGELADQAMKLIQERRVSEPTRAARARCGVWLDTLTARLLDSQFCVVMASEGPVLLSQEREIEASRPLLGRPTPCVGRDAELGNLEGLLGTCIDETEARAALVTGPPGAGKSRLRLEFRLRLDKRGEPVTALLGRGDMTRAGAPYGILASAFRRLCGIAGSEPADVQRQRLTARIGQKLHPDKQTHTIAFIGELCGIPFADADHPALLAARREPQIMRDWLRRAVLDWLGAECANAPVVLILDDLHFGDALTIALLDDALSALKDSPLFVLAFARPEVHATFPGLWAGRNVQQIVLKPLSKKACERLIAQILGTDFPAEAVARAVEQSGGNALFLEELIRALAEGNWEEQTQTVIAMLQARIGRLDSGTRRAVRAASIFGQIFHAGGVAHLLGAVRAAPEIHGWLQELVAAELIHTHAESRLPQQKAYAFRHAIVRDAAYTLLTPGDLAAGHRLAGEFLEQAGEKDAATIADHYERGEEPGRAALFYVRAAGQCLDRYDLQNALHYCQRTLSCGAVGELLSQVRSLQSIAYVMADKWRQAYDHAEEALRLLPISSPAWLRTAGPTLYLATVLQGKESTQQLIATLSRIDPREHEAVPYLYSMMFLVFAFSVYGRRAPASVYLERMRSRTVGLADPDLVGRAFLDLAETYNTFYLGEDAWRGVSAGQRAFHTFSQIEDLRNLQFAQRGLSFCQSRLGAFEAATKTMREGLAQARRMNDAYNITLTELTLSLILAYQQDGLAEAGELAAKVLRDEHNARPIYIGGARYVLARCLEEQERLDEAEAAARASLQILIGILPSQLWTSAVLIRILMKQKRHDEGRQLAEDALRILNDCGGLGVGDIAVRVAIAEARSHTGDEDGARAVLQEACKRLAFTAGCIPDPELRQRFLTRVPENSRLYELAAQRHLVQ